ISPLLFIVNLAKDSTGLGISGEYAFTNHITGFGSLKYLNLNLSDSYLNKAEGSDRATLSKTNTTNIRNPKKSKLSPALSPKSVFFQTSLNEQNSKTATAHRHNPPFEAFFFLWIRRLYPL